MKSCPTKIPCVRSQYIARLSSWCWTADCATDRHPIEGVLPLIRSHPNCSKLLASKQLDHRHRQIFVTTFYLHHPTVFSFRPLSTLVLSLSPPPPPSKHKFFLGKLTDKKPGGMTGCQRARSIDTHAGQQLESLGTTKPDSARL